MHTVTIRIPTYEKNYDNFCEHLTDECHAHARYMDGQEVDNIPCPINAFRCPFNYESCFEVEPDDWFKVIVIDSKPWD